MTRTAALLLVLTLGLFASRAAVRADEPKPPPTADEVAALVAMAWKGKVDETVKTLAALDDPDPWLVADALLLKGEREAAEAFAKAAPRKDVDLLPDFVTTWSNSAADKAAREAIAKLNAGLGTGRVADGLAAVEAVPDGAMPFLRLRLKYGKGLALRGLGRGVEAADAFSAVATEFEGIGWLQRAAAALRECIVSDVEAKRVAKALETAKRLEALAATRGSKSALIHFHIVLSDLQSTARNWDDAHAAATRLIELLREKGDRRGLATALNGLAWIAFNRRNVRELETAAREALKLAQETGLWPEVARSRAILGQSLRAVGRMTAAAAMFRAAATAAEKAKDPQSASFDLFMVGRCLGEVGLHEEALEPLRNALAGFEAQGPSRAAAAETARARLAWSLAALGKLDEARPLVERGLATAATLKDPYSHGFVLRAAARLLAAEGKVPEALAASRKAYEAVDRDGEGTDTRLAQLELAEAQRAAKEPAQAMATFKEVAEASTKSTDDFTAYKAASLAARLHMDRGEYALAIDYAQKSLDVSDDFGDVRGSAAMSALIEEARTAQAPR